MLDIHRLRVFRAVVATGSVNGAASSLGYTPSAISQHLSALQRETGLALVERRGRGIEPTSAGVAFAAGSARSSIGLAQVESMSETCAPAGAGSLRISYFASAGATWIPPGGGRRWSASSRSSGWTCACSNWPGRLRSTPTWRSSSRVPRPVRGPGARAAARALRRRVADRAPPGRTRADPAGRVARRAVGRQRLLPRAVPAGRAGRLRRRGLHPGLPHRDPRLPVGDRLRGRRRRASPCCPGWAPPCCRRGSGWCRSSTRCPAGGSCCGPGTRCASTPRWSGWWSCSGP